MLGPKHAAHPSPVWPSHSGFSLEGRQPVGSSVSGGGSATVGTPVPSRSPPGTQDRALRRQETQMRPTAVCGDRPPAAARPVGMPRPREPALAPGESEQLAETRVAELWVADWARESTECSSSTRAFGRC